MALQSNRRDHIPRINRRSQYTVTLPAPTHDADEADDTTSEEVIWALQQQYAHLKFSCHLKVLQDQNLSTAQLVVEKGKGWLISELNMDDKSASIFFGFFVRAARL
jgi:hypothetical protein